MVKSYYKLILLVLISSITISCDQIFEEDISNDDVTLQFPINGLETIEENQTFRWQEDEDITLFRFQLYTTDAMFSKQTNLVVDTLSSSNLYRATLDTGSYQWRVRGENSGYETAWSQFRNLRIFDETNNDTTLVPPDLTFPDSGDTLTDTIITFDWDPINLDGIEIEYRIQVSRQQDFSGDPDTEKIGISSIEISKFDRTSNATEYWWRVQSSRLDNGLSSEYSAPSRFILLTD